MKALIFNGSPRKEWNTHEVLNRAMEGVQEAGAEAELIHLYDYEYKGCVSCFACKRRGNDANGLCICRDGLTEVLKKAQDTDVLIFGSPVYLHGMTAQMRAFLERLLFPITTYLVDPISGRRIRYLKKIVPTGLIYTMNNDVEAMEDKQYPVLLGVNGTLLQMAYGYNEILYVNDTYQFTDYRKYEANLFDEKKKAAIRERQFPLDSEKAYELGKRLVRLASTYR